MTNRGWLRINCLVALALSVSTLCAIDPTVAGAFTPDTAGYLAYDAMRQPLYGIWANNLFNLFGNWRAVGFAQLGVFLSALTFYYAELLLRGLAGRIAIAISSIGVLLLLKLGVAPLIVILMTEGLFFSGLVLLAGLALRATRKRSYEWTVLATMVILFLMTQLRPAALLTLALPALALAVWVMSGSDSRRLSRACVLMVAYSALLSLGPIALGKKPFQLGASGDTLGFALLPRVGQLPLNANIVEITPEWRQLAQSWQAVEQTFDFTESVLFDAQLQEAIRFDLAPKVLFRSTITSAAGVEQESFWKNTDAQIRTKELALRWIALEPSTYLYWCSLHFLGTLTAASYASEAQRMRVWKSLRLVDERTWRLAPLRDDYPNNSFSKPLKSSTALMYFTIRLFACLMLAGGAISVCCVIFSVTRRRVVHPSFYCAAFGFAWIACHALAVGLTSFPEFRFVYVTLWGYLFFGTAAIAALSFNKASDFAMPDSKGQPRQ